MQVQDINVRTETKWAMFYGAANAAGVWFCAFVLTLGLVKWTESRLSLVLVVGSFAMLAVTVFLMVGAMLEASEASREASKSAKATGPAE